MRKFVMLVALVVALGAIADHAYAATDPPPVSVKGIEGPDIRYVHPKGTEGPDVRFGQGHQAENSGIPWR